MGAEIVAKAKTSSWPAAILYICLTTGALLVWKTSLSAISARQMDDLGLISVLPASFYIAFALLTLSFCFSLYRQDLSTPILLLHLVASILMLYGTTTLIEETPRLHVAWRHAGFTDYIIRNGDLAKKVDAYFDWPGFFALSALWTEIAGFDTPLRYLTWASIFFNLLYLGPLVMILHAATTDRRVVWLGAWFFYLMHWPEYDFFAPQAFNYFFYMVILGILLQWFRIINRRPGAQTWFDHIQLKPSIYARLKTWLARDEPIIRFSNQPFQRAGLIVIITALFAASVTSHMLSPFFTFAAVTVLVLSYRISPRMMPLIMAILIGSWLSYMAVSYLSGHLSNVTEDVGNISNNLNVNLVRRIKGSPEHIFVVQMRLIFSVMVWGLFLLGWVRRVQNRHADLTFTLLSLVPFPLIALQSYGGEMLLRIFLFALPPMLFFAAALFYPSPSHRSSGWIATAAGFASLVFLAGFLLARYGNERMDYFTPQEVRVVAVLYEQAEPGSQLVAVTGNLPWRYRDYEQYRYTVLSDYRREVLIDQNLDLDAVTKRMTRVETDSYLVITRSQRTWADMFFGWEPGTIDRFVQALTNSRDYRLIYENEDGLVFMHLGEN